MAGRRWRKGRTLHVLVSEWGPLPTILKSDFVPCLKFYFIHSLIESLLRTLYVPVTRRHKWPLFSKTSYSGLREITCYCGNFNSWTKEIESTQCFFFFFCNTLAETFNFSKTHFLICKMNILHLLALNETV